MIKEVPKLKNVIDFLSIKTKKQNDQLQRLFHRANSLKNPQEINKLVDEKTLALKDHKMFLAFLAYLEEKQLEPAKIFKEVLTLPQFQFEAQYAMNWQSVVQLCFTFLAILKESDPAQYEAFIINK